MQASPAQSSVLQQSRLNVSMSTRCSALANWFNPQREGNQPEHGSSESLPTANQVQVDLTVPAYLETVPANSSLRGFRASKPLKYEYLIVIALSMLSIAGANAVDKKTPNYIVPKLACLAMSYGMGALIGWRCNNFQPPKNKTAHVVALCAISGCLNVIVDQHNWRDSILECSFALGNRFAMIGMVKFENWVNARRLENRTVAPVFAIELGQIDPQVIVVDS